MNLKESRTIAEQCKRDAIRFHVYESFRPNYDIPSVTRKFYSKHEAGKLSEVDPGILNDLYVHFEYGPKVRHEFPETTNQEYGWICDPLVPPMRDDIRFFRPVHSADFIKHECKILGDVLMQKPKFLGKPFFLQ